MKDAVARNLGTLHPTATDNAPHGDTLAQAPRLPGSQAPRRPGTHGSCSRRWRGTRESRAGCDAPTR